MRYCFLKRNGKPKCLKKKRNSNNFFVMTVRWKAKQLKDDTKNLYIYYLFILFKQNLLQRPRLLQNLLQNLLKNLLQRPKLLKSHNPSSLCYCQFLGILGQGPPLQQRCHSQIEYVMFVVGKFGSKWVYEIQIAPEEDYKLAFWGLVPFIPFDKG